MCNKTINYIGVIVTIFVLWFLHQNVFAWVSDPIKEKQQWCVERVELAAAVWMDLNNPVDPSTAEEIIEMLEILKNNNTIALLAEEHLNEIKQDVRYISTRKGVDEYTIRQEIKDKCMHVEA